MERHKENPKMRQAVKTTARIIKYLQLKTAARLVWRLCVKSEVGSSSLFGEFRVLAEVKVLILRWVRPWSSFPALTHLLTKAHRSLWWLYGLSPLLRWNSIHKSPLSDSLFLKHCSQETFCWKFRNWVWGIIHMYVKQVLVMFCSALAWVGCWALLQQLLSKDPKFFIGPRIVASGILVEVWSQM